LVLQKSNEDFVPPKLSDYYPKVVIRLYNKIIANKNRKIILFGFSNNMKWLFRLLKEDGQVPILCDWREKFIKYDCGGHKLIDISKIQDDDKYLLVICFEEINLLKNSISFLQGLSKNKIDVIYDRADPNIPYRQETPYKEISEKASNRAISMIRDEQLFDLIQFISQTKNIPGDVVEYGSLYGGSGAVLAEAINYFGRKKLWLFDTFSGIPTSKYGLDFHWNNSFSDNSFSEVKDIFSDLENVEVVQGNICDTYDRVQNKISFGYLASDTYESGEILLNFMWPKLNIGGIIAVCDYGSYPNALPLTVYVDNFTKNIEQNAFIYRPEKCGIVIMKTK
jgi:hypothetical protein